MRREAIAVGGALAYFFALLWAVGGQEPIKLDGNVEVVKVPQTVVVMVDKTVVKSLPVRLIAPTGGLLYRWRWPAGVNAVELSNVLEVTESPKGEVSFSVQWAVIDFEKKLVTEKAAQVAFYVGEVKPPDPPKPPEPDPPVNEVLGFTTMASASLSKVPAASRSHAAGLANNFEAVAAKLAATASMTIDQANADLKQRNQATLGIGTTNDQRQAWLPWFIDWQTKADGLNASGKMTTREHYVTAYNETAAGLRRGQ